MLTKEAIAHMSRGNRASRKSLQMFLEENKKRSLNRVLHDPGTEFSRPKPPEYIMAGRQGVCLADNAPAYTYRPMSGHAPGRKAQ
jgi:hypothetical protein